MAAFVLVDANIVVQKKGSAPGLNDGAYIDLTSFVMSATLNFRRRFAGRNCYGRR